MTIFRAMGVSLMLGAMSVATAHAADAAPAPLPSAPAAYDAAPRDPALPPHAIPRRKSAVETPTHGAALKAQVEHKLRQRFEAADLERRGSITREQARAAGLGLVVREFDRIDTARTGRITFDDFRRFLGL
jgi:hypothetical protein